MFRSIVPCSPEPCLGPGCLFFSSVGALRSSKGWGQYPGLLGWASVAVASFVRIQFREIPRLHLCLAARLSIMALTGERSNWPISFRNV